MQATKKMYQSHHQSETKYVYINTGWVHMGVFAAHKKISLNKSQ